MATADFKAPSRELLSRIFNGNHEMIKKFESLYRNDDSLQKALDLLQEEVDRVEAGAGLNTDGTYIKPSGTNYIDNSTSLATADILLDEQVGINASDILQMQEKILNKNADYQALEESQLIIVDATSGEIEITLPNPADCLINNISYKIGVTKKDVSSNFVIIKPFASELVVGETQQDLQLDGEVLNFITDGVDWYLGA